MRWTESAAERFSKRISKSEDGCWLWLGVKLPRGYGRFWFGGGKMYAHRAAWILANGAIPDGLQVLHRCDNPPCVRPEHLFLGTASDNMRDAALKLRTCGEKNAYATLTEQTVRAIRLRCASGERQEDVAKAFSTTQSQVSRIVLRKRWKHVS